MLKAKINEYLPRSESLANFLDVDEPLTDLEILRLTTEVILQDAGNQEQTILESIENPEALE